MILRSGPLTEPLRRLTLGFLLSLLMTAPVFAAQETVKLGTVAPEGSVWHDALLEVRERWREITDGAVDLRIYAGGMLGGEAEMVRKMQRRNLDAVAITGAGLPRIDRSVEVLNIPLLFESYAELDHVRSAIAPDLERHLKRRKVKILGWADAGWIYFFAKSPVRTPDDLRALRLWISAGAPEAEELFRQFGFNVTPLPITDMLTGLQTGLIEAIDVPPLFALLDRSYKYADHMTDLRWAPLIAATVINLDVWNRLPAEHHEALQAAYHDVAQSAQDRIRQAGAEAIGEMRNRGLTLVTLDEAHREAWRREAREAWPALREHSVLPELFDRVHALAETFKAMHPNAAAVETGSSSAKSQ